MGNIHQAVPNYVSNTLFAILEKVKPDYIHEELDSSYFTPDFKFKEKHTEKETIASRNILHYTPILNQKRLPSKAEMNP